MYFTLPEEGDGFQSITIGENIFSHIFELFNKTANTEAILDIAEKYSPKVFDRLKEFAEHIKKSDLNVDMTYFSPNSLAEFHTNMEINFANNIISTIETTSIRHDDKLNLKGKFTALNCKTGHFTFESHDELEYSGYFDALIKNSMPGLNFVEIYKVVIQRNEEKNIADAEARFTDKVIAIEPAKK